CRNLTDYGEDHCEVDWPAAELQPDPADKQARRRRARALASEQDRQFGRLITAVEDAINELLVIQAAIKSGTPKGSQGETELTEPGAHVLLVQVGEDDIPRPVRAPWESEEEFQRHSVESFLSCTEARRAELLENAFTCSTVTKAARKIMIRARELGLAVPEL